MAGHAERLIESIYLFDTKQPAIERARELSARQHTELDIHNKDGRISGKDSHGHDSYPPRG
jgi:hypothetical protein